MSGRRIEILVRRQGQPERRVTLEQGTYQVGRAEDNALVLPDIAVSRRHARITVTTFHVLVEDVGSGNGTYLRGRPIRRQEVADGDEVLIDPFLLVFSIPPPTSGAEDAPPVEGGPRLDVVSGLGMRGAYPLAGMGLTLGRSEQRDIVLTDPSASRKHAEVFQQDGRWYVRDFGSVNGTWVNDQRVREHALQDGDRIRIGNVDMRFVDPAPGTVASARRPLASMVFQETDGHRSGPQLPPGAVVPPTAVALGLAAPPITSTPLPLKPSMLVTTPPADTPMPDVPGVPDGLKPTAAIPRAAILSSARAGPGGPPRSGGSPASSTFPQATTAPPPDLEEPPPTGVVTGQAGTAGEFGTGVLTGSDRTAYLTGQRSRGSVTGPGRSSGTFLDRNVVWLTLGIGLLAALLIGYKVVRDAVREPSGPWVSPDTAQALPEPAASTVAGLLEEGNALFREKRYVESIERYAAVQKLDPRNPVAVKMGYHACEFLVFRALRDEIARRTTSMEEQRAAYERAMAAARATVAGRGGTLAEAVEGMEAIRAFFPDDAPLRDLLARLEAMRRGQAEAARRRQQEAHTDGVSGLFAAAEALAGAGDLTAAVPAFEAVLAADPERRTSLSAQAQERIREAKATLATRGLAAYRQGLDAARADDPLTARTRFRECLRQDPYNQAAERRMEEVQQALDRMARNAWAEAQIFEASNQLDLAVERYRQVVEYSASSAAPLAQKAETRIDALLR